SSVMNARRLMSGTGLPPRFGPAVPAVPPSRPTAHAVGLLASHAVGSLLERKSFVWGREQNRLCRLRRAWSRWVRFPTCVILGRWSVRPTKRNRAALGAALLGW